MALVVAGQIFNKLSLNTHHYEPSHGPMCGDWCGHLFYCPAASSDRINDHRGVVERGVMPAFVSVSSSGSFTTVALRIRIQNTWTWTTHVVLNKAAVPFLFHQRCESEFGDSAQKNESSTMDNKLCLHFSCNLFTKVSKFVSQFTYMGETRQGFTVFEKKLKKRTD